LAIEQAVKRGRTNAALAAIEGQRRTRAGLVDERKREAGALAVLQAERAAIGAKGRQIDTEAAPIRYVAELVGEGRDDERAIRWLILMMVLCCDPLAIVLTAATASAAAVVTTITLLATSGTRRAVPALQCGARDRLQRAPVAPTLTPKAGAGVKLG
jgi:hypothetical protein